jgi:hypothetical protein
MAKVVTDTVEECHISDDCISLDSPEDVGGKRNPEENVTDNETNENHRKKTFSRDTTENT